MKNRIVFLYLIIVPLFSCESNGTNHESEMIIHGPTHDYTQSDLFNRDAFDRERSLWLTQNIQTYFFYQFCSIIPSGGPISSYQYIKNGEAQYFKNVVWDNDLHTKRPGEDLYTTKGRYDTILTNSSLSIPITSLYTQIDALEKGKHLNKGPYKIYIRYDSNLHYPSTLHCLDEEGHSFTLDIEDLIVNPTIPDEGNAKDPYPLLPEDM